MSTTLLIIISGPSCSGKTTLGRAIAREFHLPLFSRDDIKESLFDALGIKDRAWSKKLGIASYAILYRIVESMLLASQSFIVESNFDPEFDSKRFLDLQKTYTYTPLQVVCRANGEILFQRFEKRAKSTERHPGHVDNQSLDEFRKILLTTKVLPLNIDGKVVDIDTSDFNSVDYDTIFSSIKSATNLLA